jgi:hypothetical protein
VGACHSHISIREPELLVNGKPNNAVRQAFSWVLASPLQTLPGLTGYLTVGIVVALIKATADFAMVVKFAAPSWETPLLVGATGIEPVTPPV